MASSSISTLATFLVGLLVAGSATATPLAKRDSCVYSCGSVCYWQSDIDAAVNKGYSLYQSGETVGRDEYPHQYDDREGFDFPTSSPWFEFPILSSFEVYSGGSPGADRVIFDSEGNFDSVITHTGSSHDGFSACTQE